MSSDNLDIQSQCPTCFASFEVAKPEKTTRRMLDAWQQKTSLKRREIKRKRDMLIIKLYDEGWSVTGLAEAFKLTGRHIFTLLVTPV